MTSVGMDLDQPTVDEVSGGDPTMVETADGGFHRPRRASNELVLVGQ